MMAGTQLVVATIAMGTLALEPAYGSDATRTPARGPIIDMHLHAFGWDEYGDPPPPNEVIGERPAARSDAEALAATLAEMERHGIVLGVASGPPEHVERWLERAPDRLRGGSYVSGRVELPDAESLREDFVSGRLAVHGELGLQYRGIALDDPRVEEHFALAEELDVPVALHTGLGDTETPYGCCPAFRVSLGNPVALEDALVRHPRLRVYLMHAGYPYLQETIALLHMYPQVYVDIAVLDWALPRAEFHRYLEALVTAGFGERILFGTDQMIWPEAIPMAIEGVESATFLTPQEKRDIFYWNAARFLRLPDDEIARHHKAVGAAHLGAETSRRVDEVVRKHMVERRIPGASIAIVTADGAAKTAAYGTAVLQHDVPARIDTVYEIASLTKQFTAAAVLLLVEESKLGLDDPISDFVDAAPEAWQEITLRRLLTHTAGLPGEASEFASLRDDWRRYSSRELMLAAAIDGGVTEAPGARFDYGSVGYFLAALAVEKASGSTFRDFIRERILEPLGMASTFHHDELRIIPREAQGYSILDGELVNIWRDGVEEVAGGWGLFSNVPDLVRWDRALRDGEILSAASLEAMFAPVELADGSRFRYGLGWWLPQRNGIPYQYHSGVTGTEILRLPAEELTVIVLTNLGRSGAVGSNEANSWGLADRIAATLISDYALETKDLPRTEADLNAYSGTWRFGYGEAHFFGRDARLWIDDAVGTEPMLYQGNDTFGFDGDPERLVFHRGPDGRVTDAVWISETAQDDRGRRLDSRSQ